MWTISMDLKVGKCSVMRWCCCVLLPFFVHALCLPWQPQHFAHCRSHYLKSQMSIAMVACLTIFAHFSLEFCVDPSFWLRPKHFQYLHGYEMPSPFSFFSLALSLSPCVCFLFSFGSHTRSVAVAFIPSTRFSLLNLSFFFVFVGEQQKRRTRRIERKEKSASVKWFSSFFLCRNCAKSNAQKLWHAHPHTTVNWKSPISFFFNASKCLKQYSSLRIWYTDKKKYTHKFRTKQTNFVFFCFVCWLKSLLFLHTKRTTQEYATKI